MTSVAKQETMVVREGTLYLGHNPSSTSSKDWKPYLFVLKHNPELKRSSFDYFKDVNKRWQRQNKKGDIELWPSFQISLAHNSSYKFPFKITTASQKNVYYLAASTFEDMNKWYNSLQTQSYLVKSNRDYIDFPVQSQPSLSTTMIGAVGDCILALTPQRQIVCALSPRHQIVGIWPFSCLRKYWGGKDHFGFQSGRRSPRGEGEFIFATKRGEEIYRILEKTIKLSSPMPADTYTRPPASLPSDPTGANMPPVSSSESDDDEGTTKPPPVPDRPPDLLHRLSMASISPPSMIPNPEDGLSPLGVANPDVSDVSETSPAYMVRRNASLASRPPAQVPLTTDHALATTVPDLNEDTYSHAAHTLPKHFSRNPSLKIIEGGTIYNGLVRSANSISRTKPDRNSKTESEAGAQLYDLAYPPTSENPKDLTTVCEGDYGSMGDPKAPKRKMFQTNGEMLSRDTQSFGAKLRQRVDSVAKTEEQEQGLERQVSDGLTANPLYGSKENILNNNFVEMEGAASSLPDMGDMYNVGADYSHGGVIGGSDSLGVGGLGMDDSMVMNPVYGEHKQYSDFSGDVSTHVPLSPLEDSLTTNPIYTTHSLPLHNNKAKSEEPLNSASSSRGEMKKTANNIENTPIDTDGGNTIEDVVVSRSDLQEEEEDGGCSTGKESKERDDSGDELLKSDSDAERNNEEVNLSGEGNTIGDRTDQEEDCGRDAGESSKERDTHVSDQEDGGGRRSGEHSKGRDAHISDQEDGSRGTRERSNERAHVGDAKKNFVDDCDNEGGSPLIRRDTKGYSKVNKKNNEDELNDGGSPPPPLPARMYSDDSST